MLRIPAFLFLFCTLISLQVIAQSVIKGRVVNAVSQEPVAGASVFISNTSKGTVSDKNG
ncbi:MAG: carboxypeptidase-like regulatory domain-containing protein, partial [Chitinophagaceae bacterium]|nr:carboxypeptidase-like regulatory domain-containing protein [Chitinophagaceae bacterium]